MPTNWESIQPLRLPLATNEQERMHRLTWVGLPHDVETLMRMVFGPVSTTVLMSLQQIGLPAMRQELAELRSAIEGHPSGEERADALSRAVHAWRLSGLAGRIAEQLCGIVEAVEAWQVAGEPVFVGCHLGEDFLRASPSNPHNTFARYGSAKDVSRLLDYPQPSALVRMLTNREITATQRRLRRSSEAAASAFALAAAAMTDDNYRTFIRWKHSVSITSPRVVPIWISRQEDDATKLQALEGLVNGFGIIDLEQRGGNNAYVIIWPDSASRLTEVLTLADDLLSLTELVLACVLCWGDPRLPAIPLHPSITSIEHEQISEKLARQHYRRRLATRAFALGVLPDVDGETG
jgi:hypothetical protein